MSVLLLLWYLVLLLVYFMSDLKPDSVFVSAAGTLCSLTMTSYPSLMISMTTWQRRHSGNSLSGSAHGTPHGPIKDDTFKNQEAIWVNLAILCQPDATMLIMQNEVGKPGAVLEANWYQSGLDWCQSSANISQKQRLVQTSLCSGVITVICD